MTKQKDSFSGLDLRSENGVHISPDSNLGDIDDKNLSEQIRDIHKIHNFVNIWPDGSCGLSPYGYS